MVSGISAQAQLELLQALRDRYREANRREKGGILDEFVAVAKCHRKHAVRLLGRCGEESAAITTAPGRRVYDEAVREALVVLWEASDRICGKRLKAVAPAMIEAMERHGHLELDNDSAFLNETLVNYCTERCIELTRSRPYRKNDQAWIEQKNGAVVRRFAGYDRYSGPIAGQALAHLYGAVRLYVNSSSSRRSSCSTRPAAAPRSRSDTGNRRRRVIAFLLTRG